MPLALSTLKAAGEVMRIEARRFFELLLAVSPRHEDRKGAVG
jgi:hypothetical protein